MSADRYSHKPPLDGVRVIDLADPHGAVAGRILWTLGAHVDKVEPPGGCRSRQVGPFAIPPGWSEPVSAYWLSVDAPKRSVTLDLETEDDMRHLDDLLDHADVLIHSRTASSVAAGLDKDSLAALHPDLIVASITPFGYEGPHADRPAEELTIQASSGLLALIGDPDRPPLPIPGRQAAYHAGAHAAGDVIAALCERAVSGHGQFLDVSMQAAMIRSLLGAASWPVVQGRDQPGAGDDRGRPREVLPGLALPRVASCRDGFVLPAIVGTAATRGGTNSTLAELLRWRRAAGQEMGSLDPEDFVGWEARYLSGELLQEKILRAVSCALDFVATLTKRELLTRALDQQLPLAPILTVKDLFTDEQLEDRQFWMSDRHSLRRPGPFARLSRTPLRVPTEPSPDDTRPATVHTRHQAGTGGARRLADVRVADFTWAGVGPLTTKWLADHGATVVHVESRQRIDTLRRAGAPWPDGPDPDRSHFFSNYNTSKLGMTLDLHHPAAKDVARRLVEWADVVVESYTPGVLGRLGVDLNEVRAARPDMITASTSLRGGTGRAARMRGYGSAGAALSGLHALTGWPDRAPCGPGIAYTDSIAPKLLFAAITAAIFERSRSGLGQHIDLSQVEASMAFIEPEIIAAQSRYADDESASAAGHLDDVLPTAGTQRFLAVAATTPEQFAAARRVVRGAGLAAWARERDAVEAAEELLAAGVPAAPVLRPSDLHHDAQLAHREYFIELLHPHMGRLRHDGSATVFSRTPPTPRSAGPVLGEHNHDVLAGLLGYSAAEIHELAETGALT